MILVACVAWAFFLTLVPYQLYFSGQLHYFLYAFHLLDPHLFARDWLVVQTTNPHPFFAFFIAGLKSLGNLPLALFVIHGLQLFLVIVGVLNLSRTLTKDSRVGLLVLSLLLFYFSDGLGQETLYSAIVQPADIGKLFYLFSLVALFEEKILLSWIFLGCTSLFDFLSGMEGLLLFLFLWVVEGKNWPLKRMVLGFVSFLLLGSPSFIAILKNFSPWDALVSPELLKLLFNFRGPHHYRIGTFELAHVFRVFFPLTFLVGAHPSIEKDRCQTLVRFYVALLLSLCLAAAASIEWFYFPLITQLRLFRLSPFLLILGLIFMSRALVAAWDRPNILGKVLAGVTLAVLFLEKDSRLFVPLSLFLVFTWQVECAFASTSSAKNLKGFLAPLFLVVPFLLYWRVGRGWEGAFDLFLALAILFSLATKCGRPFLQVLLAVLVMGVPALGFHFCFPKRFPFHSLQLTPPLPLSSRDPGLEQTLAWIRTHSPQDAILLTPPSLDGIRFFTERAIVVDFHANPYRAKEVKEWKERLEAVSGIRGLEKWVPQGADTQSQRDLLRKGYLHLRAAQVEDIARRYGASYFLTESSYAERDELVRRGYRLVLETPSSLLFELTLPETQNAFTSLGTK